MGNKLEIENATMYEGETFEGEKVQGVKGYNPLSRKVYILAVGPEKYMKPYEVKQETVKRVQQEERINTILIDEENGIREPIELDMVPREGDRMFIRRPSEGVTEKVAFYLVLGIIHDAKIGEKAHAVQIHVKELANQ